MHSEPDLFVVNNVWLMIYDMICFMPMIRYRWHLTLLSWLTWYRIWVIVKYMYDCYELCDYGRKEDMNYYIWMFGTYIYICVLRWFPRITRMHEYVVYFIIKRGTWYLMYFHFEWWAYLYRYVLRAWQGCTVKQWFA